MMNLTTLLDEKQTTKILQTKELEMLKNVKQIFDENGIPFYLAFGTAIGCARHKGFIPWDDDIDIYIRGRDYEKVRRIFNSNNTVNLQFQDYTTVKDYPYFFPKIVSTDTVLVEESLKHLDYKCGVYIDVFPVYGVTNNKIIRSINEIVRYFRYCILRAFYSDYKSGVRGILHKFVKAIFNPYVIQSKLEETYKNDKEDTDYIVDSSYFGKESVLKSELFDGVKMMPFENSLMPMQKRYHERLTLYYGDYMCPPEEKDRVSRHHIEKLEIPEAEEMLRIE